MVPRRARPVPKRARPTGAVLRRAHVFPRRARAIPRGARPARAVVRRAFVVLRRACSIPRRARLVLRWAFVVLRRARSVPRLASGAERGGRCGGGVDPGEVERSCARGEISQLLANEESSANYLQTMRVKSTVCGRGEFSQLFAIKESLVNCVRTRKVQSTIWKRGEFSQLVANKESSVNNLVDAAILRGRCGDLQMDGVLMSTCLKVDASGSSEVPFSGTVQCEWWKVSCGFRV